MNTLLQNRVALVTGSTSGIGRAIAERFAANGARVVITGRRRQLGETVVANIHAAGGTAAFFAADLEQPEQGYALVDFCVKTFGGLDILVNNAALLPRRPDGTMRDGPIHLSDEDYWEQCYHLDLGAVFAVCKRAVPHLLSSQHAAIINIASSHAIHGQGLDVYSAMKGALVSLSRSMAFSYAHRIRVNCICPGVVIVERTQALWAEHPEMHEQFASGSLTRVGLPEDVAQCALYLASDAAGYVSGAIIPVDGGITAKGPPPPMPKL